MTVFSLLCFVRLAAGVPDSCPYKCLSNLARCCVKLDPVLSYADATSPGREELLKVERMEKRPPFRGRKEEK
ncbi:hypothetical protein E4U45_007611 [Claviceps purpurea]|nr:hypothetical protein E4U45_007611 [Claviceps purpurea]